MKEKVHKINWSGSHRMALLHAIGQLMIVRNGIVTVSDVLPFMNVSKPTAIKMLKHMCFNNDELIMIKNPHMKTFGTWEFCLHPDMLREFDEGVYKPYFDAFVNQRFVGVYNG
jgi:hypothetical protein